LILSSSGRPVPPLPTRADTQRCFRSGIRELGEFILPYEAVRAAASPDKAHDDTGKTFELAFCTVARWKNAEIVEEHFFYDQVRFRRQIGML
jgi:hypothetical protein